MNRRIYRFADFELLPDEGELRSRDARIPLQEKPLLLLTALVESPGRLVTRDQLRAQLWSRDVFVDYEQGINVAVRKAREALGDSIENPRFIQTVAKKGYRFVAAVEVPALPDELRPAAAEASAAAVAAEEGAARRGGAGWRFGLAAAAAVLLLALGIWRLVPRSEASRPARFKSIAVLPLRNLSPDAGQDYVADGITEELITDLAQTLPLRVVSGTSVMRYRQTSEPITQIARELGVDAIVEGAVTRSGDRVAVTVQLIDATEDRHLWAQTYDRKLPDLLVIESEVSQEIATQVGGALTSRRAIRAARSRPVDPQVYQLYLRGRYFWNKRSPEGVLKAAEYFQQAVDLDPNYAKPYVGLADCYLFGQPPLPIQELTARARAMAKKALQLDDSLGEAHATLGLLAENTTWDWAEAEREYKRAIELNPNYATAHHWYGEYLALNGRFEEAFKELRLAGELDPLSLVIIKDTGEAYYLARRYDEAIGYFRKALEMDPSFVLAHRSLGLAYAQTGEFSSAVAELQKAQQLQADAETLADLGYVYGVSRRRAEAEQTVRQLTVMAGQRSILPDTYASIYAGLGDNDKAFEWLEKASREWGLLTGLKVDPRWDKLRADTRFAALMKRVGLPS